jgi:hypothetical protein
VVVANLYFGRSVLILITLAMLLSFLLAPLVNLLRRIHLGRVPSVLLAVRFRHPSRQRWLAGRTPLTYYPSRAENSATRCV